MRKSLAAWILGISAAFFVAYLAGAIGKRYRHQERSPFMHACLAAGSFISG
jgi:hypothetical protein